MIRVDTYFEAMGNRESAPKGTTSRSPGKQVQVVLLSGERVSFKRPVSAKTVMNTFPDHRIIHCFPVEDTLGTGSSSNSRETQKQGSGSTIYKSVLKPHQYLKTDANYLIVPKLKSTKATKAIADSWVMFAFSKCMEKNQSLRIPKSKMGANSNKPSKMLVSIRKAVASFLKISSPCLLQPGGRERSLSLKYRNDENMRESHKSSASSQSRHKGSQPVESRDHSSTRQLKSNASAGHDMGETFVRGPYDRPHKATPSKTSDHAANYLSSTSLSRTAVPNDVGLEWQPSPEMYKGFLIPLSAGNFEHQSWRPVLSCIPELSKVVPLTSLQSH